jgi:hypothetical protein
MVSASLEDPKQVSPAGLDCDDQAIAGFDGIPGTLYSTLTQYCRVVSPELGNSDGLSMSAPIVCC